MEKSTAEAPTLAQSLLAQSLTDDVTASDVAADAMGESSTTTLNMFPGFTQKTMGPVLIIFAITLISVIVLASICCCAASLIYRRKFILEKKKVQKLQKTNSKTCKPRASRCPSNNQLQQEHASGSDILQFQDHGGIIVPNRSPHHKIMKKVRHDSVKTSSPPAHTHKQSPIFTGVPVFNRIGAFVPPGGNQLARSASSNAELSSRRGSLANAELSSQRRFSSPDIVSRYDTPNREKSCRINAFAPPVNIGQFVLPGPAKTSVEASVDIDISAGDIDQNIDCIQQVQERRRYENLNVQQRPCNESSVVADVDANACDGGTYSDCAERGTYSDCAEHVQDYDDVSAQYRHPSNVENSDRENFLSSVVTDVNTDDGGTDSDCPEHVQDCEGLDMQRRHPSNVSSIGVYADRSDTYVDCVQVQQNQCFEALKKRACAQQVEVHEGTVTGTGLNVQYRRPSNASSVVTDVDVNNDDGDA